MDLKYAKQMQIVFDLNILNLYLIKYLVTWYIETLK